MRVLFLHPEDDPLNGPWAEHSWDLVFDLGICGQGCYQRWSELLGCAVQAAERIGSPELDLIRELLGSGLHTVVDQFGLDWWDLIALEMHAQLERWARLQKLAAAVGPRDQVFVSRAGFESSGMRKLLGRNVQSFPTRARLPRIFKRCRHVLSTLSPREMVQILGDKYDTDYKVRRFFSGGLPNNRGVVLLPSAYVNASRTELAYAEMLPETDFLLVATRHSGWTSGHLSNVTVTKLASYASGHSTHNEFEALRRGWLNTTMRLTESRRFGRWVEHGALDGFENLLRDGLFVRDAWMQVFESHSVLAVLCADDVNLSTRIPLKIAAARGLPAISCHHGALDGRYRLRPKPDGVFLAKGRMEHDYLSSVCRSPRSSLEIGAAGKAPFARANCGRGHIVFFSEPYEIAGGRSSEFFRDVLPPLAAIAAANDRELVIKLHPAESLRDRRRIAGGALSDEQFKKVRWIAGPLTEALLRNTWFAVTVLSTTAVDCTLRGIPTFLCGWLDYSPYGYLDQMAKFGVGNRLSSPEQVWEIPNRLDTTTKSDVSDLWEPIRAERLQQLLGVRSPELVAAAV